MVYAFVRFTFFQLDRLFALSVALLFLVHPLHVEVVANIKGRDEILALSFGLSSVILLVKAFEQRRLLLLIAGGTCFVAALLSKTNAVTLLPLAALVAWYRSKEPNVSRALYMSAGTEEMTVCRRIARAAAPPHCLWSESKKGRLSQ